MMLPTLIAQASGAINDTLSGGAGWAGAGLLGLVLGWLLLKHLPDKDKQIKDLLDTSNARADAALARSTEEKKNDHIQFQVALEKVIAHCDKEMQSITGQLHEKIERLEKMLETLKQRVNS